MRRTCLLSARAVRAAVRPEHDRPLRADGLDPHNCSEIDRRFHIDYRDSLRTSIVRSVAETAISK